MTEPASSLRPSPDALRIAAETLLDARTVQRFLDNKPVRPAAEHAIVLAMVKLGIGR